MTSYNNGLVQVVSGSPTLIVTVASENGGVLIQNVGNALVFLGGPTVTSSGANQGVSVAAGATLLVPSVGGQTNALYGVTAATAQNVAFLMPQR
jgi:hypothetical protein